MFVRAVILSGFVLAGTPAAAHENSPARIGKADCRKLVVHYASADVAYKSGVDVRGKPVAPADLSSNRQIQPPNQVSIDIVIPLRVFRTGGRFRRASGLEANAGTVTVDIKTGEVSYNGQLLNPGESEALYVFCRQQKY